MITATYNDILVVHTFYLVEDAARFFQAVFDKLGLQFGQFNRRKAVVQPLFVVYHSPRSRQRDGTT